MKDQCKVDVDIEMTGYGDTGVPSIIKGRTPDVKQAKIEIINYTRRLEVKQTTNTTHMGVG